MISYFLCCVCMQVGLGACQNHINAITHIPSLFGSLLLRLFKIRFEPEIKNTKTQKHKIGLFNYIIIWMDMDMCVYVCAYEWLQAVSVFVFLSFCSPLFLCVCFKMFCSWFEWDCIKCVKNPNLQHRHTENKMSRWKEKKRAHGNWKAPKLYLTWIGYGNKAVFFGSISLSSKAHQIPIALTWSGQAMIKHDKYCI